ncbi:hypothetical protein EBZ35_02980 [bacterium]|nr:hypothetical protein [bacterium]
MTYDQGTLHITPLSDCKPDLRQALIKNTSILDCDHFPACQVDPKDWIKQLAQEKGVIPPEKNIRTVEVIIETSHCVLPEKPAIRHHETKLSLVTAPPHGWEQIRCDTTTGTITLHRNLLSPRLSYCEVKDQACGRDYTVPNSAWVALDQSQLNGKYTQDALLTFFETVLATHHTPSSDINNGGDRSRKEAWKEMAIGCLMVDSGDEYPLPTNLAEGNR